ncbi:hypothetical protein [Klebsiella pneumoniae]|uniref:hypothetical protein n=1 Tax=Klebsiella pneumoniae TaxID=573 RepID=UPI00203BBAA3|nr:hypothetical protein [Klebsiella pneumoniae]HDS4030330.1 hypothetical protein [Klebsiella pneumoniae subsp. pneumoniae]GKL73277.1 hypothetical protein NUBL22817_51160 [Klebsiella pneumoniae]HBT0546899.1 hypothetical protein [Klebsiella pneumoniae]HBX2712943.1 hypothetical protein [Klebsiella pneumoniae]HCM7855208.1 hypothetical protein [Klebsiella pneumoniae]
MALKMTFNFNGVTVVDGVLNVIMPSISTDQTTLNFGLAYRVSESDPLLNSETYSCPYDLMGADPFIQAYNYIKSLSQFNDAVEA